MKLFRTTFRNSILKACALHGFIAAAPLAAALAMAVVATGVTVPAEPAAAAAYMKWGEKVGGEVATQGPRLKANTQPSKSIRPVPKLRGNTR